MARLFDAYVVADWTAAETKKLGDSSLWIGVAKRDVRFACHRTPCSTIRCAEDTVELYRIAEEGRSLASRAQK